MQQVDLETFGLSPEVANTHKYMASMGIYVFKTDVLLRLLR
jgi:glucose-1-phosphate adenylyltransferase